MGGIIHTFCAFTHCRVFLLRWFRCWDVGTCLTCLFEVEALLQMPGIRSRKFLWRNLRKAEDFLLHRRDDHLVSSEDEGIAVRRAWAKQQPSACDRKSMVKRRRVSWDGYK
jgi:hypothetical protein